MSESELEEELRSLRPAPPSAALERGIGQALARSARAVVHRATAGIIEKPRERSRYALLRRFGWALAGAAAVAAVLFAIDPWSKQAQPIAVSLAPSEDAQDRAVFEPLDSTQEPIASEDG